MTKKADQIDSVRALLEANYSKQPPAKPKVSFDERSRIAESSISTQAVPQASLVSIVRINVSLLDDSTHQNRLIYPDDEIEALAETMRSGLLTPLRVQRKADGRFEILAGHRRKRAAKLLGWDVLDCIVVVRTDTEAALDVVIENETHQGLSDYERAKGYRHLVQLGVSQAELARQIGVNRSLINNRLKFFALPSPLLLVLEKYPACTSQRWIPEILELIKDREELITAAAENLEKVALGGHEGNKWTMQTLINDLKKKRADPKAATYKPIKLSITNNQNKEILTIQRDAKRAGVYEIRILAAHSFNPEEFEQHLIKSMKGVLDS